MNIQIYYKSRLLIEKIMLKFAHKTLITFNRLIVTGHDSSAIRVYILYSCFTSLKLQHKSKIQIPLVFTKIKLNPPRWRVNSHIGHIIPTTCMRHARWSSWKAHTHIYISSGKLNSPPLQQRYIIMPYTLVRVQCEPTRWLCGYGWFSGRLSHCRSLPTYFR